MSKLSTLAVSFFTGLLLGLGVACGGMTDGRVTSSFFNLANIGTQFWDPSLGIMFAVSLLTNVFLTRQFISKLSKPLLADKFSIPTRNDLTWQLFVGSAIFGMGWAVGGFCPGPALVASLDGHYKTLSFVIAMCFGMGAYKFQHSGKEMPTISGAKLSFAFVVAMSIVAFVLHESSLHPPAQKVIPLPTNYFLVVLGGLLVGSSVALMMILSGKILGISGILNGLFSPESSDKDYRAAFAAGLIVAGLVMRRTWPERLVNSLQRPIIFFLLGGFMVGYGTSLGSGCTSGHGIAGLTRLSRRSIAAVATFFAFNILVTTAMHEKFLIGTGWKNAIASDL